MTNQRFHFESSIAAGLNTSNVTITVDTTTKSNPVRVLLSAVQDSIAGLEELEELEDSLKPLSIEKVFTSECIGLITEKNIQDLHSYTQFSLDCFSKEALSGSHSMNTIIAIIMDLNDGEIMDHLTSNLVLRSEEVHGLIEAVIEYIPTQPYFLRFLAINNSLVASFIRNGLNIPILNSEFLHEYTLVVLFNYGLMMDAINLEGIKLVIEKVRKSSLGPFFPNIALPLSQTSDEDSKIFIQGIVDSILKLDCGEDSNRLLFNEFFKVEPLREICHFLNGIQPYVSSKIYPDHHDDFLLDLIWIISKRTDCTDKQKNIVFRYFIQTYPQPLDILLFKGLKSFLRDSVSSKSNSMFESLIQSPSYEKKEFFEEIFRSYPSSFLHRMLLVSRDYIAGSINELGIMQDLVKILIRRTNLSLKEKSSVLINITRIYPCGVIAQMIEDIWGFRMKVDGDGFVDKSDDNNGIFVEIFKEVLKRESLSLDEKRMIFHSFKRSYDPSFVSEIKASLEACECGRNLMRQSCDDIFDK